MQIAPKNKNEDICFIIYGSRHHSNMKSFGPKQFYRNFYQHHLLSLQLQAIFQVYPKAEVILVIGQDGDKVLRIKDNRIRIVENQLYQTTNECEDIRLALNNTNINKIVLINSDLYINKYAIHNLTSSGLICDSRNQLSEYEIGVNTQNNKIISLDFKIEKKWCNITYLDQEVSKYFKNLCNRNNQKLFLFEVLNQLIYQGIVLNYLEHPNMKVFKIDTPENYRKFQVTPQYQ